MADMVKMDAHQLVTLSEDIMRTAEGFAIQVPEKLGTYARLIRDDAKSIVWEYAPSAGRPVGYSLQLGSSNEFQGRAAVADSIHAGARSPKEWYIRAGKEDLPLAGLWEMGNQRSSRDDTTFRHPVFGDKNTWVEQPKWPFFSMALKHLEPVVLTGFAKLIDTILLRHRL